MADNPIEDASLRHWPVVQVRSGQCASPQEDALAVEEPLELRIAWDAPTGRQEEVLSITMRTPGEDLALAAGWLFSEGIIRSRAQLASLAQVSPGNAVLAELAPGHQLDLCRYQRQFYTSSSCGVCGKMAIESLSLLYQPALQPGWPSVPGTVLAGMPDMLRTSQRLFSHTGGVHAAGLFSPQGDLLLLQEDVGRHNAVDKVLGACLLHGAPDPAGCVLVVSGRAGFELVQKALSANIAVMVAVGAPTSLAVELAATHGMTLAGFVRAGNFNLYSCPERVVWPLS